jgi:hypothetical protein
MNKQTEAFHSNIKRMSFVGFVRLINMKLKAFIQRTFQEKPLKGRSGKN